MERVERYLSGAAGFHSPEPFDGPDDAELLQEELDLLPEFCHFRDEGCPLSPSCLECPFPKCAYEKEHQSRRIAHYIREKEIRRVYTAEKPSIRDLASRFQVSRRTVQRALQEIRSLENP
jgi:hypothetical protein